MSIEAHLNAIADKRQTIKDQIEEEMHRPMPHFLKIQEMKKQNLKLKEEMMQAYIERKRTAGSSA